MERTVPRLATDEIELYLRTVYSLLRSTTEVKIRTLEEVHAGINSSMHLDARKPTPDTSAFIYAILRLPDCIREVKSIILGQSASVFAHHGIINVESWQSVSARARRRQCYFDRKETLACYIASESDIEDVIPVLTAYQIEWNKLHLLLKKCDQSCLESATEGNEKAFQRLSEFLEMSVEDLDRLRIIWGSEFGLYLQSISQRQSDFGIRLLSGSLSEYWRATRAWWDNIVQNAPEVLDRPVYFISSNTHSIANLLSGFALSVKEELIELLAKKGKC